MKNHLLLASVLLTTILTGCHTVKGTFDGMASNSPMGPHRKVQKNAAMINALEDTSVLAP